MVTKKRSGTKLMIQPAQAITQRINFASIEYDVPLEWARAACGLAYTLLVVIMAEPKNEIQRNALVTSYTQTFGGLNELMAKPMSLEKMGAALLGCWEQAQGFIKDIDAGRIDTAKADSELLERLFQQLLRTGGRRG